MNRTPAEYCYLCGHEEREPFTPAAFSMLMACQRCDEPTCSQCGEDDGDLVGEIWEGSRLCTRCIAASKLRPRMNPRTLRNGLIGGLLCWAAIIGTCRAAQAQPPVLDCQANWPNPQYFVNRTSAHFCVPSPAPVFPWPQVEWEILYLSRSPIEWHPLGTTSGQEITFSTTTWDRLQLRYRGCAPFGGQGCSPWSDPSIVVGITPDLDTDHSGGISVGDLSTICRNVVPQVLNKRIVEGVYK